ncbi:hypothetical protein [Nostoc flagelliforme]
MAARTRHLMALQNSGMNWGKQGKQRKQGGSLEIVTIILLSLQRQIYL